MRGRRGGGGWDAGLPSPVLFVPFFQIFLAVRCGMNHQIAPAGSRGGGTSREVWVGMCRRGHQTLTLFKTKIAHFGHFATPL